MFLVAINRATLMIQFYLLYLYMVNNLVANFLAFFFKETF